MKRIAVINLLLVLMLIGKSYAQTTNLYALTGSETFVSSSKFSDLGMDFNNSLYQPSERQFVMVTEDYAKKAKTQKIVAWVLVGAGVGLMTTGLIVAGKDKDDLGQAAGDTIGGAALITTGAVIGVVSIPFFIMSSKNKKKAGLSGEIMLQPIYASVPGYDGKVTPGLGINLKF